MACLLLVLVVIGMHVRPAAADPLSVHAFRMAGDATRMRVVVEFDREPDFQWFLLRGPHRLVVDLPESSFAFDSEALEPRGLVSNIRYGKLYDGHSRMILEVKGPFAVERVDMLRNETSPGYRMVADIVAASEEAFEAALAEQAAPAGSAVKAPKAGNPEVPAKTGDDTFTLVIDPGHGGIDGGAEGVSGTQEKDVTLAFARQLRDAFKDKPGISVVMTRDGDRFLRLDERVRIARQAGADLFVSIHADTIRYKGIRGATVYTISERASDAVAKAAADRENLADSVAGVDVAEDNRQVADILVDLMRRETHGFSVGFARSLIREMSDTVQLIKNPHRSAGFRVLRAPDVPSVLVELGYLSNKKDEAQLLDADWRARAIDSMAAAIRRFAGLRNGAGG
ncbi:N-acetylmuramoyl-L-alanine amidase [Mesorhizobium xinjiangense]|uniref:N-acetylmuramoyl-L-alanine amidase n=1 Tax=Mesorhizobium xinjiangense TaxID=2678685 RepID=UPI0012EE56F5